MRLSTLGKAVLLGLGFLAILAVACSSGEATPSDPGPEPTGPRSVLQQRLQLILVQILLPLQIPVHSL